MEGIGAEIPLVAGSLAVFAVTYAVMMLATRPGRVAAAPATPELGTEPPAVVNLLVNRWRLTEDASEATLLDLAARGHVELRQPTADPRHTTIHLPEHTAPPDADLRPYERRVLHRVQDLAVRGVVPVTALTFRDPARARQWNRRLHHEVTSEARAMGLSQRRLSPTALAVLTAVAALSAAGVALAAVRQDGLGGLWLGVLAFAVLTSFAARPVGVRDAPAGRAAAARWLGVRAWLRAHEEFASLPPAAVTVWDRYLAYGAALGTTRTASEVLDLGLGDRRRVWSCYGGHWRRVRVRYPWFWRRYGRPVPGLLLRAGLALGFGGVLVWLLDPPALVLPWELPEDPVPQLPGLVPEDAEVVTAVLAVIVHTVLPVLALLLAGFGAYTLIRTLVDLFTTRTITGEVLWVQVWRSRSQNGSDRSVPWLDYLAVDDGQSDRTVAWGLPRDLHAVVRDRDVVTIRVRPWTRRVVALSVVERGRTHSLRDAPVDEPTSGDGFSALSGLLGQLGLGTVGPAASPGQLLTAEEVSQAVGEPVHGPQPMPAPGPLAGAMFRTAHQGKPVLMVGVASGAVGRRIWQQGSRHQPLPGVADGAFLAGDRAVARVGEHTLVLTLGTGGGAGREWLPQLLRQAAARLPQASGGVIPAPGG